MLHRMKLRVLYGEALAADRPARRRKIRVILLSGLAVYFPFLMITYLIYFETRILFLMLIGLLASLVSIPVALYAYAEGFGRPLRQLWQERPEEIKWFSLKIGFLYAFSLYWMILGIVEFLFGYHAFRAALISFVAAAVARDGFEIGYLRARQERGPRTIFPDGRPIGELFRTDPGGNLAWIVGATFIGGMVGALLGSLLKNSLHQTVAVGAIVGVMATAAYVWFLPTLPKRISLVRFFIWPGFTMAATYFLILAYLLRIILRLPLSPAVDLAILTAVCAGWMTLESLFLGFIKKEGEGGPAGYQKGVAPNG